MDPALECPTELPPVVEFKNVTKKFGDLTVIRNVTFCVPDLVNKGEFIAILGPSGCGKSTVLRLIAGLRPHHPATTGEVLIANKPVGDPGADRAMVFQDYTSFDNRTVEDNVAFGLECRGVPTKERREQAASGLPRSASTAPVTPRNFPTSSPAGCASAWRSRDRLLSIRRYC